MPPSKRKFETTTPTRPTYSSSLSASESRGSYRTQSDSGDDVSDSSHRSWKKPKLSSTPGSTGKGRRRPKGTNAKVDDIDFLSHPGTPEPTPSKTPRAKSNKTPRTVKKSATSGLVIISRSQGAETSASTSAARTLSSTPSKSQRRVASPGEGLIRQPLVDLDRTPRVTQPQRPSTLTDPSGDELGYDQPLASVSSRVPVALKPAVPGAARGRKKVPGRQLTREDSLAEVASSRLHSADAERNNYTLSTAAPRNATSGADIQDDILSQSPGFANLRREISPKKSHSAARKALSSPQKRRLANGDSYVEYMVPMAGGDEDLPQGGLSSGDEGAYISTSASGEESVGDSDDERLRLKAGKGRMQVFPLGVNAQATPRISTKHSRSSLVSRPGSPSNYASSSRGASPSPSFPPSDAVLHSSSSESDSEDSIYEHQHHVNPARNLEKLASLARLALTAAEDMRKKGVIREGESPLPKSFLMGVVVEPGKLRTRRPDASPSKKNTAKSLESGTEAENGEETTIIRALPERHLGQVSEEPVSRSRSWMDTVLGGPSGPQASASQVVRSAVATDSDNPFDAAQPFRRTNSQPLLSMANAPHRPDITKLPSTHSEPSLETILAAYDMTPSRARTIQLNMTPSKNRVFGTPSRTRLFGTPSRTERMKEISGEENRVPASKEFDAWLSRQQTVVLRALQDPPWATVIRSELTTGDPQPGGETDDMSAGGDKGETEAVAKLRALLGRTMETGEGNSCLLVGPRGSGKTRTVTRALRTLTQPPRWHPTSHSSTPPIIAPQTPSKKTDKIKQASSKSSQRPQPPTRSSIPSLPTPFVIHLSGHAQTNDRLAMREIARQLVLQSGEALEIPLEDDVLEADDGIDGPVGIHVPTATHLPQIVGALARQAKPVVVVLDAFDLFAEHARQALLYCLLDTVQSCRAGEGSSRGLAVVGVTSRIDCLTMLEKRVKSRFSHRIIRVSPPATLDSYINLARATMSAQDISEVLDIQKTPKRKEKQYVSGAERETWLGRWKDAIERVLSDKQFKQVLEDVFELSRDVRLLLRILSDAVASLTPASPWLTVGTVARSIQTQCAPLPFAFLQELTYPCVALLVATQHVHDRGHDVFTFRMLCAEIKRELGNEAVTKALVQMQGRGLGLLRVPESVLETAFESLVAHKVLVLAGPASNSTGRVFVRYRCVPERSDIKEAVERLGHSALKRWFIQGASN